MATSDLDYLAKCNSTWQSLTAEEKQLWENYAATLDGSVSAYDAFIQVNMAEKPERPSSKPPFD